MTVSPQPDAEGYARPCAYCRLSIVWMRTYLGQSFAFDAHPVSVALDDGTGWVPGRFDVGGRMASVMAPLSMHPGSKRRRIGNVMQLHRCPRRIAVA